jgi:hypothetical protein
MASKKSGRLAGLAALAGLAYMATRDKDKDKDKGKDAVKSESKSESKSYDRNTDTGMEVMPSYATKKEDTSGNAAMFEKEPGFETKTTPAKVASVVKAPAAKAPSTSVAAPSAPAVKAPKSMDELMSSYKPRRPDVKLRDTRFTYNNDPKQALYSNKALRESSAEERPESDKELGIGRKKGGAVKKMASGGMTSSASKRGDGIAQRGKTKGRVC